MRAIILAAGRGSRLKGHTEDRPKCLSEVGGRPLLRWQLAALRTAGITDIVVVTGYRADLLADTGTRLVHNADWADSNMVASLRCAQSFWDTDCIISYADIIYGSDIISALMEVDASWAVAYDPNWLTQWRRRFDDPLSDAESFALNDEGEITDIGRRVTALKEIQGQYMGLMKATPDGLQQLGEYLATAGTTVIAKLDMTTTLRNLMARGHTLRGVALTGDWFEVDTVHDLELVELMMADGDLRFNPPPACA